MADTYPSPCDKCSLNGKSSCKGKKCDPWRIRHFYRQKQINAFARRLLKGCSTGQGTRRSFAYAHPQEIRDYLRKSPCASCSAGAVCDTPCPTYIRWYDARMEVARKKMEKA